jgi:membrane-bound lytic murein transglycosylase B
MTRARSRFVPAAASGTLPGTLPGTRPGTEPAATRGRCARLVLAAALLSIAPLAGLPGVAPSDAAATETAPARSTAKPVQKPAPQSVQPAAQKPAQKPAQTSSQTSAPTKSRAALPVTQAADYPARPEVRDFVRDMVERHGFDETALLATFGRTRTAETAIRLMQPAAPGFKRSWIAYRARFVEPIRIREGLRFWASNADAVRRASQRYGVPEEILVSIIGVETIYGRNTGDFRVMDALTTLSFDYPRRAAYFREELEHYLLLAREAGFDPLDWRGSFAGAVGLPQFMPASIRRHAVDFDGDGRVDLRGSATDAIGSVASFLANHGWQAGGPTHFTAAVEDEIRARPAVEAGIPPRLVALELADLGVTSPQEIPVGEKLSLIDLPNGDDTTHYVLGANNFWVVTRYNRSYFYAMAVIDLARALREAMPPAQARARE